MHLFYFHDTYEPADVVANLIYHIEACLFNLLKKSVSLYTDRVFELGFENREDRGR